MKSRISNQSFGDNNYSDSESDSEFELLKLCNEDIYSNHFTEELLDYEDSVAESDDDEDDVESGHQKGVVLILTPIVDIYDENKTDTTEEDFRRAFTDSTSSEQTNGDSMANYWRRVRNQNRQPLVDRYTIDLDDMSDDRSDDRTSSFVSNDFMLRPQEMVEFEEYYKQFYDRNNRTDRSESLRGRGRGSGRSFNYYNNSNTQTNAPNITMTDENVIITPQMASNAASSLANGLSYASTSGANSGIVTRPQLFRRQLATRGAPLSNYRSNLRRQRGQSALKITPTSEPMNINE